MFDPFNPPLNFLANQQKITWANLSGAALALSLAKATEQLKGPLLIITPDNAWANKLERELKVFINDHHYPILQFPDRETLPYDFFSPHQDIISDRLLTLSRLPHLEQGIIIVSITTLMHRLAPPSYLQSHCFSFKIGDSLNLERLRVQLIQGGYYCVSEVRAHGEFAVRGSLLDVFPMGTDQPIRIDLLDNQLDSLRYFDLQTQQSHQKIDQITILPAKEFPTTPEAILHFKNQWKLCFPECPIQKLPAGIEYYLPLFFDEALSSLIEYIPSNITLAFIENIYTASETFWGTIQTRYEQYGHDRERPLLSPQTLFIPVNELFQQLKQFPQIHISSIANSNSKLNANFKLLPDLTIDPHQINPLSKLIHFIENSSERILLCAESKGRREVIMELLARYNINPLRQSYLEFLQSNTSLAISIAPLENGGYFPQHNFIIITEAQLYAERVMQRSRRKKTSSLDLEKDHSPGFQSVAELSLGAPIVHIEYGVGRYRGLTSLNITDITQERLMEFITIEYANNDKLYVPISSLHLITQYSGSDSQNAPLNRLGTDQWEKAKRKALEKARDVAAELLDIYARRESKLGFSFNAPDESYFAFAQQFPFEETADQAKAIQEVLQDMQKAKPMDRLICGDVGFGKTEVALRAAFLAVMNQKQVAVLVPTTLLAQQHFETFSNRFADWPIKVELLSRFRTPKEEKAIIEQVKTGNIDVLIGTHKIIQNKLEFKQLGLLIIDEEHRFGVHQKEAFKAFRTQVDILTLTATPIPRTLNMALSSIRDLSIISTPPKKRLSIKTFVHEYRSDLVKEAIMRELMRGGQVYYLYNNVETIAKITQDLRELMPNARIEFAHGQMPERDLERVMSNFYHQRFDILVCTTIIETGIDIPSANTIIIYNAHQFGLAQLHQLRGRVGRSHHQAYAYCLTPPFKTLNSDALKRLQALESLEELGSGFTLATHDLEIRGAGELLGDEQSGNIHSVGFTLYMELLNKAVSALKAGKELELSTFDTKTELDLNVPALIPESYLPDVQARLILYKRISQATTDEQLYLLKGEIIDRFGLVPQPTHNLFKMTSLKLLAQSMGIKKIEASTRGGRLVFNENPKIDSLKIFELISKHPHQYQLKGSEQLRFTIPMDTLEDRFNILRNILEKIQLSPLS